jgi:hypothetical protein
MNENKRIKKAFIVSAISLIIVGIIFVITIIASLIQIGQATSSQANVYDMNCLTQPIEKPLTECKK